MLDADYFKTDFLDTVRKGSGVSAYLTLRNGVEFAIAKILDATQTNLLALIYPPESIHGNEEIVKKALKDRTPTGSDDVSHDILHVAYMDIAYIRFTVKAADAPSQMGFISG